MDPVKILVICAFILGACPFSVWIGKLVLHKDIREFGDGNPGSTNVFRAGGKLWGIAALLLDFLKGMPFIIIARSVFGLEQSYLYVIAFAAIAGHAFSPFLGFHGGKAVAVYGGTLIALQQWDVVLSVMLLLIIGFLFIGNDSWTVMLATAGTASWLLLAHKEFSGIVFMSCVSLLMLAKNYHDFKSGSQPGRLVSWVRSRR